MFVGLFFPRVCLLCVVCLYVLPPHPPQAYLYSHMGRYEEAHKLYKDALAILEKNFGTEHPDVAQTRNKLAWIYFKQVRRRPVCVCASVRVCVEMCGCGCVCAPVLWLSVCASICLLASLG